MAAGLIVPRTLGIDPSLARTGYAILEDSTRCVVEAGVITTNPRATLPARLSELAAAIEELLEEFSPRRLGVEDLFAHYNHPRTAILMGHARGVILLAAGRRDISVETFTATRIKKSLTGNGHATKLQMQRAIMATLGLSRMPEPSDVADAIAAGLCALSAHRRERQADPLKK